MFICDYKTSTFLASRHRNVKSKAIYFMLTVEHITEYQTLTHIDTLCPVI